jgi:Fe-S cluster biogenesis protein NfuA/nitrite reductase/ring-hydroxylating ferredoxin subunit
MDHAWTADAEIRERVSRIDGLLEELDNLPEEPARTTALETVQALVLLYGDGLSRIVKLAADANGPLLMEALSRDEVVGHLLLVHGLHPLALQSRVAMALDEVRPYLRSHGGDVELVRVEGLTAVIRLVGSCHGCQSSRRTFKLAIEEAIRQHAPDLELLKTEGVPGEVTSPLTSIAAGGQSGWHVVGALPELEREGIRSRQIAGKPVLFLKLETTYYAYSDECPGCGSSFEKGVLSEGDLHCAECLRRYDLHRAGVCLDAFGFHLEPLPLLVDDSGILRVAVA